MSDPKQTAIDYLNNWRETQARVTELEAENRALREGLEDAIDGYSEYSEYAGEYLVKKHRVEEDLVRLRALLPTTK